MGRAGWVVAVVVMLSACGGGGPSAREYAVPSDFCGVEVAEDLYEPLFPPGSEVERVGDFEGSLPVQETCSYRVDGEVAVLAGTSPASEFETFISSRELDYSMGDAEEVEGEFEAVVWPGLALVKAPCTVGNGESSIIQFFTVGVRAYHPEGDEESRRVLGDFVQALEGALLEQIPCAEYADE